MLNFDIRLIREINRRRFRYGVKKILANHYNKVVFISLVMLFIYCVYFVLVVKSNFTSVNSDANSTSMIAIVRKLYLLFALFMSNLLAFYSRKEILKMEVTSLITNFPKINFFTTYLFIYVPIVKAYLMFIFLIALPSYISFLFYDITFGVSLLEMLLLLLGSFLYYCIVTTINLFLTIKKTVILLNAVVFLALNLFLAYITNLVTDSRYFLVYYSFFCFALLTLVFRKLYLNKIKLYYGTLHSREQIGKRTFIYRTNFQKNKYLRYLQFELKRILDEGTINDYIFTFISLIIAYVLIKLFVPLEYASLFNFIIASFGMIELQVIFSTSLGLFLASKAEQMKEIYINVRQYFYSLTLFYVTINILLAFFLNSIFWGEMADYFLFSLNVVTAVLISTFLAYMFSYFISKNIYLIVINIIAINIAHTLLVYVANGSSIYLVCCLAVINIFLLIFFHFLFRRKRAVVR